MRERMVTGALQRDPLDDDLDEAMLHAVAMVVSSKWVSVPRWGISGLLDQEPALS